MAVRHSLFWAFLYMVLMVTGLTASLATGADLLGTVFGILFVVPAIFFLSYVLWTLDD